MYLATLDMDQKAASRIEKYLDLIKRRANGACKCVRDVIEVDSLSEAVFKRQLHGSVNSFVHTQHIDLTLQSVKKSIMT